MKRVSRKWNSLKNSLRTARPPSLPSKNRRKPTVPGRVRSLADRFLDVSQQNRKTGENIRPAVLWFTGLSGSGKTTIAKRLTIRLKRLGLEVEHLDGDWLRNILPRTGFSRKERDQHIRRAGVLASVLEKHGIFVVASFISPYRESRGFVRKLCKNFIEIYLSTPLEECERRDVKGLYAQVRRGEIRHFTGISDPYEKPRKPELTIDTTNISVKQACDTVVAYLMAHKRGR